MASRGDSSDMEQETRLRAVTDQLPAIVWTTDAELRFTSSSGGGLGALGLVRDQVVGRTLHEYFGTQSEEHPAIAGHLRALAGESARYALQWRGHWFETYVVPFRQAGVVVGAVGLAIDVTERKRAEEQSAALQARLRERYKLQAVGQLASGLAHEINNPLQSVMNFAQLIRSRCEPGPLREYSSEILNEVQRIAASVRNLQSFVHQEGELPVEIRVHELVERTLSLFRTAMQEEQIAIDVVVPADLPAVWGKLHAIEQVLVNLLIATRDALNERHPAHHADKRICVAASLLVPERRTLRLTIEDHGCAEVGDLSRVFEPLPAIEGRAQGTHVTLAISHELARESGGDLCVEAAGELRRFHLDLPLAAER